MSEPPSKLELALAEIVRHLRGEAEARYAQFERRFAALEGDGRQWRAFVARLERRGPVSTWSGR